MSGKWRRWVPIGMVVIGAAAVVTVGIVVFATRGEGDVDPAGFDYNCSLPGLGYPWLEQWDTIVEVESGGQEQLWTWEEPTAFAGFFDGPEDFRVTLPVPVDADGHPESMTAVYQMLCRVHPDFGGGGLRPLTAEEMQPISECFDGADVGDWPLFTDGTRRASNEAHLCSEEVRVYGLPDLPPEVAEALTTSESATSAAATTVPTTTTTTTQPPADGERSWRISCRGYEVKEGNPYWDITTGLRHAMRFDYWLDGQFRTVERNGKVEFDRGSITSGRVGLTEFYEPGFAWEVKPYSCTDCDAIRPGAPIFGTVLPGNEIVLSWGLFAPTVDVTARIVMNCTPMPGCAQWKMATYPSELFFDRLSALGLVLEDGFSASETAADNQKRVRVQMWCDLKAQSG